MTHSSPVYQLERIKDLVLLGCYRVTGAALSGAGELGLEEDDVLECVDRLTLTDFCKTMESEFKAGLWQDVYRTTSCGFAVYVKMQIVDLALPGEKAVIISFKRL